MEQISGPIINPTEMYIKIINPSLHGKTTFSNSGSCKNLIDYLSKENEKLPLDEKELFFNHQEAELSSNAVLKLIEIGRASCRERVEISVVGVSLKKKRRKER